MLEFSEFQESPASRNFSVKYYKGLGTSTPAEARACFRKLNVQRFDGGAGAAEALALGFAKANADARKQLIQRALRDKPRLEVVRGAIPIDKFVDSELVYFSIADVERSIPHVMDGLKPSQRKAIYHCLNKKMDRKGGRGEQKVRGGTYGSPKPPPFWEKLRFPFKRCVARTAAAWQVR